MKRAGFTLIEILVVIGITAMLVGLALPNLLGARLRARDTRRKAEAGQVRNALRLYYNDYGKYPADSAAGVDGGEGIQAVSSIKGCGINGNSDCPCSSNVDFAAGGTGCDNVYMTKFPSELGVTMHYHRVASGDNFCLVAPLENVSDSDIDTSQSRCSTNCSSYVTSSDYVVCAD